MGHMPTRVRPGEVPEYASLTGESYGGVRARLTHAGRAWLPVTFGSSRNACVENRGLSNVTEGGTRSCSPRERRGASTHYDGRLP